MRDVCELCPRHCVLEEGQTGFCRARKNEQGLVVCQNYGKLTALALDPVEKKPLRHFYSGSMLLSAGSYGCNLSCPYCQNHEISMADGENAQTVFVSPESLAQKAGELAGQGNIGVAYTYNEPLVGYEYVRDCAQKVRAMGLKNVLVTNAFLCEAPFSRLLRQIDALNIDLKAFTQRFYDMLGGDLETVKRNIRLAWENCHVEVSTLIVPGENDSQEEMEALSQWLASVDRAIPLHVSRFFPRFRMKDKAPTPTSRVRLLAETAKKHLRHVYCGNC